jgi:putative peptidoglycan lipid II flippase
LGSPVVAYITASPYLRSTVRNFAYFLVPEIFFYGLSTLGTSLLNAQRRFIAAAFVPALNNVVVMAVLVVATKSFVLHENFKSGRPSGSAIAFIGLGTTAGIVVMSLALVPPLRGWLRTYRWSLHWSHPAVRAVGTLAPWAVGYVVTNQIAWVVVQRLAQRQTGGVSAYAYASTFYLLPPGVLAVSLLTTFTPNLASLARNSRWRSYSGTMSFGMRLLLFLVAPAAALMAVLSHPLASLLEHGKFGPADAALTGRTLTAFMIGLVGFSLYIFALRGFYSVQDARMPFYVNAVENVINIVLAVILVGRYGVVGLAVSYSAAYLISAIVTLILLKRRFPSFPLADIGWWTVRVAAAGSWCALVAWQVGRRVGSNRPITGSLVRLTAAGLAGSLAYLAVMLLLGALDRHPPKRPPRQSRRRMPAALPTQPRQRVHAVPTL